MNKKKECDHEWRIIDNFYKENSRTNRLYPVYCIFCLSERIIILEFNIPEVVDR